MNILGSKNKSKVKEKLPIRTSAIVGAFLREM